MPDADDYIGPEAQARVKIDRKLIAAGWMVPQAVNHGVETERPERPMTIAEKLMNRYSSKT